MLNILGRKTSSNVQKVLWCCGELGLAYEREDIGGEFGGNDRPDYRALNPNGLVPTVIDDGLVLWESNTIIRYLAARHAAGTLWPTDPRVRAVGEKWMDWQISVMSPAMQPVFRTLVRTPPEKRDMAALAAARASLSKTFAMLDRALADRAFLAGERFTVCDIPVGIATYRWYTMEITREDYPHLRRWYDRLAERAPFRAEIMVGLA
ncbi:MAG: glutathione S-transferase family protein [Alphaproteobacteria bacterium]|nr:glutathione S-transferase family protein [Alphaproteobacteria bacterium]